MINIVRLGVVCQGKKEHNIWSYAVCALEYFHSTGECCITRIYALGWRQIVSLFFRKHVTGIEHKRLLYSNFSYIFMPVIFVIESRRPF